jgi:hypothetical protein
MKHNTDTNCGAEARFGDEWTTRADLAKRWNLPLSTLNGWASKGLGPRYAVFGRHARYRLSDVIAWENEQVSATGRRASGGVA